VDLRLAVLGSLVAVAPCLLDAQDSVMTRDTVRVLVVEHRFGLDSPDSMIVVLERHVVYRLEVTGPGTPVFLPARSKPQPAFLVPLGSTGDSLRRFELYALQRGPHVARVSDRKPGTTTVLRVYRDVVETERIAGRRDREIAVGLTISAGHHSGYRLDPTGGADPRGGSDQEVCFLFEAGSWLGTCVGGARQTFPDAGFNTYWVFLELQKRLLSRRLMGDRRTDLGAVLRYSQGVHAGPRHLDPALLGFGLYVDQHLATAGRRRGWRIHVDWQHGRLGSTPETERLDTNRFTVGITWIP
jgi:hypothetical protein